MKYFGGCDVGSTYTKTVILDENGAIVAANTIKSKINSAQSAKAGLDQAIADAGLKEISDLTYLIGTGYGRNKVPQADENISEISCHAMGVHVTDPSVRAIIDIGGQDVKGIAVDTDGTVKTFAMNDKCAAGTGRFFESMANAFEMSLEEFSKLSLTAENVIPITAQCTVFAESEVISLIGQGEKKENIAFAVVDSIVRKVAAQANRMSEDRPMLCLTGGLCECSYISEALTKELGMEVKTDPQSRYAGAIGAALGAVKKGKKN